MSNLVPKDDPILKKRLPKVEKLTKKHKEIIRNLVATLKKMPDAAALSANQLGYDLRVFVCKSGSEVLTIINPHIVWTSMDNPDEIIQDEKGVIPKAVPMWEGCISFPGKNYLITRPYSIKATYMNEKEVSKKVTLNDQWARLFLHETDHLNGVSVEDRAEETIELEKEDEQPYLPTSEFV